MATQTTLRAKKAFFKHKLAFIGLIILGLLYLMVIFADFIAPYNYTATHRDFLNVPPTQIHWFHEGTFMGPFIYGVKRVRDPVTFGWKQEVDPSKIYPIRLFAKGQTYKFWGLWETDIHLFGVGPDATAPLFLFGGDRLGRDVFSRTVIGSRVSMTAGLLGTFIAVFLGAIIGSVSGYFGGWIDVGIQRFIEVLRSFPRIPLWLALAMILPPQWPSTSVYFGIVIVLSFIGWMGVARVIRGMVLSLREKEYVLAAKVTGQSDMKIIVKHLVPNTATYLVVVSTLSIPGMILVESAISFLGLGIKEPMTSWGLLLSQAQSLTVIQNYPWQMIPGIFIVVAVMCFNFVGDALRDAFDPYRTVEKV